MSRVGIRRGLGVLASACLVGAIWPGSWWVAQGIEDGLEQRVNMALTRENVEAEVIVIGREVSLRILGGDADAALAVAQQIPGVAVAQLAADEGSAAPTAEPESSSTSTLDMSEVHSSKLPSESSAPQESPSPEASPSAEPSPTPEPAPDYAPLRFIGGSVNLAKADESRVQELAELLIARSELTATLIGHTDNGLTAEQRHELGLARANLVRDELVALGIGVERLSVASRGGESPVADNATAVGRAQNRRVEVILEVAAQ